jgi:hypothetical protein
MEAGCRRDGPSQTRLHKPKMVAVVNIWTITEAGIAAIDSHSFARTKIAETTIKDARRKSTEPVCESENDRPPRTRKAVPPRPPIKATLFRKPVPSSRTETISGIVAKSTTIRPGDRSVRIARSSVGSAMTTMPSRTLL